MESEQEQPAIFAQRFLRCLRLLHFIACRILGDEERAPIAIQNCRRTASRNPRHFEHEGAFRAWLVRILIDEALAICRANREATDPALGRMSALSLPDSHVTARIG